MVLCIFFSMNPNPIDEKVRESNDCKRNPNNISWNAQKTNSSNHSGIYNSMTCQIPEFLCFLFCPGSRLQ